MNLTPSIIASDVSIEGNFTTEGELQLDGHIKGDLICGSLVMGDRGSVVGRIAAESVTIRGKVNGEISSKTVRLEATAHVDGDVFHESMSVEAGARITGQFTYSEYSTKEPHFQPTALAQIASANDEFAAE